MQSLYVNRYEIKENSLVFLDPAKILYVRLFQRKYKWISLENIIYDHISRDLKPILSELSNESFLIDEHTIDSYEEIIYLLKLPQLKELAKTCHVVNLSQTVKIRSEFIRLILNHFKTQKSLVFNAKPETTTTKSASHLHFMNHCKKALGKCYKLNKNVRDVFVRVLILHSLSSSGHLDTTKNDSGQQQLLRILTFFHIFLLSFLFLF